MNPLKGPWRPAFQTTAARGQSSSIALSARSRWRFDSPQISPYGSLRYKMLIFTSCLTPWHLPSGQDLSVSTLLNVSFYLSL